MNNSLITVDSIPDPTLMLRFDFKFVQAPGFKIGFRLGTNLLAGGADVPAAVGEDGSEGGEGGCEVMQTSSRMGDTVVGTKTDRHSSDSSTGSN